MAPGPAFSGERFSDLVGPLQRELQAHCYRMMGSLHDAEDLLQETMLRAWKAIDSFDGQSPRAWLYRIATNACLDVLKRRPHKQTPMELGPPAVPSGPMEPPINEPVWMEPYPDDWLTESAAGPEAKLSTRQSVALAFLA